MSLFWVVSVESERNGFGVGHLSPEMIVDGGMMEIIGKTVCSHIDFRLCLVTRHNRQSMCLVSS